MLLIVVIVLSVGLLLAADRGLKAVRRARRRAEASRRLAAAAAQAHAHAQAREQQRRAAAQVSTALTSVMPTIHDLDPRHVE
jgi:hypothetical protein